MQFRFEPNLILQSIFITDLEERICATIQFRNPDSIDLEEFVGSKVIPAVNSEEVFLEKFVPDTEQTINLLHIKQECVRRVINYWFHIDLISVNDRYGVEPLINKFEPSDVLLPKEKKLENIIAPFFDKIYFAANKNTLLIMKLLRIVCSGPILSTRENYSIWCTIIRSNGLTAEMNQFFPEPSKRGELFRCLSFMTLIQNKQYLCKSDFLKLGFEQSEIREYKQTVKDLFIKLVNQKLDIHIPELRQLIRESFDDARILNSILAEQIQEFAATKRRDIESELGMSCTR